MPKFRAIRSFQFGAFFKEDEIATFGEAEVRAEMALGFHAPLKKKDENGKMVEVAGSSKPISPIFNHCEPVDKDATELADEFFGAVKRPEKPVEKNPDQREEIARVKNQIKELDGAYDNRWGLPRLQQELTGLIKQNRAKAAA